MAEIYKTNFKVNGLFTDQDGVLRLSSLLGFLYLAAGEHAHKLKLGVEELQQNNYTWMLSRLYLEVDDYPRLGDELIIETWPKGYDKLFATRDYKLYNRDNKEIGRATTYWLMIDMEKRRLAKPGIIGEEFLNPDKASLDIKLDKLPAVKKADLSDKLLARYSDIDINGHVTSSRYIQWIMDTMPLDIVRKRDIFSVELNHLSEVFVNNTVEVQIEQEGEGQYLGSVRNSSQNKESFRIRIRAGK